MTVSVYFSACFGLKEKITASDMKHGLSMEEQFVCIYRVVYLHLCICVCLWARTWSRSNCQFWKWRKNDIVKTLQLRLLHCMGKLANSVHWVISHVRLTDNPLLSSFSSEIAPPLSSNFIMLYTVYWGQTMAHYVFWIILYMLWFVLLCSFWS